MPYLSKKRVWTRQPTKPVTLNPKGDILAAIMPGMAFGAYRDRIAFPILDSGSAIGETFLSEGKAQKYRSTSSTSYKGYRLTIPSESSTRFVFLAYMRPSSYNASGYNSYVICSSPNAAGNEVWCNHNAGKLSLSWRRAYTTHLDISYDIAGQLPLGLYRFDFDGSVARILLNGEVLASGTPTADPYLGPIQLGGNAASYVKTPDLLYSAYSNKVLPDDYGVDNPWGIFSRGDRRIWIPSAGGYVTITCTPGNGTAAGISASISVATTISCNSGNATTAGIACSLPVVVQCGVGTATTAGVTAGISLDTSITIACNAGNATAAGVAAGISLDTSITISCNVGTATTAGVTAGISSATTITCNAGTATTAGVSATFPQSLSCNVGNATTTGITAQVEIAGQIVIGCNAGTATTAGVSANISSAFVLTCNAGTATTLGATAYFPQSLQCSPGNAIALGIDATFTLTGPTTIVCNVGNAAASGIQASIYDVVAPGPRLLVVASELRGYDVASELRGYDVAIEVR